MFITKVLKEPLVAGRLYGNLMSELGEEIEKIESSKLEEGMTEEEFLNYFTINLPKRLNGELPKPLCEIEDSEGTMDRVTDITRVVDPN